MFLIVQGWEQEREGLNLYHFYEVIFHFSQLNDMIHLCLEV